MCIEVRSYFFILYSVSLLLQMINNDCVHSSVLPTDLLCLSLAIDGGWLCHSKQSTQDVV